MLNLDLNEVIAGWDCPPGEMVARVVRGQRGEELLQLRVDLGVLQMYPDGRPDGQLYHGLPSVLDYLQHELRVGRDAISGEHWQALERELAQINYRRMALANVAEEALRTQDEALAMRQLVRVLRDIERCEVALRMQEEAVGGPCGHSHLWPTLIFNQARLLCQLRVIEEDYDDAIEVAQAGATGLRDLLDNGESEFGLEAEFGGEEDEGLFADPESEEDVGVVYLTELSRQLRVQYDIELTLRERLEIALDEEEYETAAELDDEIKMRAAARRERCYEIDTVILN